MSFSPLSYWLGVLTILVGEIFIVILLTYFASHFTVEEEDDAGSAEKHD